MQQKFYLLFFLNGSYQRLELAVSRILSKEGAPLEVFIYDSRSAAQSLTEQLARPEMADIDMVITHCTPNEVRVFADFGLQKSIPVINVNLPNDGGVRANPYFVMLNSTLKTQIPVLH